MSFMSRLGGILWILLKILACFFGFPFIAIFAFIYAFIYVLADLGIIATIFLSIGIGTGVGTFVTSMHHGHTTQFPSSDPHIGFQPNPDTRGTMNIVSTCLFAIFSCVYVAVHPDISSAFGNSDTLTRIQLTVGGIFAPDYVFLAALVNYFSARSGRQWMKDNGCPEWTLTHAFVASGGGFVVDNAEEEELKDAEAVYKWLRLNMNTSTHNIDFEGLLQEIKDRSKQDPLAKSLVVLQALKVVVQVIARAAQSLPVTVLELTTCAYVACALGTYAVWWHKPYCINGRIRLRLKPIVHARTEGGSNEEGSGAVVTRLSGPEYTDSSALDREDGLGRLGLAAFLCFSVIFGALHAVAWNDTFVNSNGQHLWRIFCIVHMSLCLLPLCVVVLLDSSKDDQYILYMFTYFCVVYYLVARVVVFLLIGLSFWGQPVDAYVEVKWLSFVPHFS